MRGILAGTARTAVIPAAVRARGWGVRHAGRSEAAVQGLDLSIEPGEKVLLLGASGAGKSTLLHALAGVLGDDDETAESGTLTIDGTPARQARGRAGLMQQDPETQVVLSRVGDDVAFGAENLAVPRAEIWRRVPAALAAVGLHVPLDHPTARLSGGQKQRLALAGILAMAPGLILLDEPTANLDPAGVTEVRDAVLAAAEQSGATLVIVEHRVAVWAGAVDRIIVLEPGGGVMLDGTPDAVLVQARARLIAAGVWVPGHVPAIGAPRPRHDAGGPLLLGAEELAVSREQPRTGWRSLTRAGRTRAVTPAAAGITAGVAAGGVLSITGPNGSGKSTLALTLAGLLKPLAGTVSAGGVLRAGGGAAVGADPYRWKASELIARIGTVFQEPEHQFVTGSVRDELAFGPRHSRLWDQWNGRPWSEAEVSARVDELLARLRLDKLADANPFTLSGGEKRRLSVGTVLAAGPRLLILDEPTFGQDANTWAELGRLLVELLDAGTAVVSVTHDADFTAALGGKELRL